jgi:predicted RNA-binding Zn-ribbon protein involved in translation (DUF1610 family)
MQQTVEKALAVEHRHVEIKQARMERVRTVSRHSKFPRDPVDVEELAREVGFCLECGDDLKHDEETGEFVCQGCGLVWGSEPGRDERIPFEDSSLASGHAESNFSPEGHLDWGKMLGQKMDRGIAADVLGGRKDPLAWTRANHVRVPLTDPLIQKLLTEGRELCNKHDLHQHNNVNHIRFADQLGIYLRLVGKHYVQGMSKLHFDVKIIAQGVFCLLFRECYPAKYDGLRSRKDAAEKYPEFSLGFELLDYCEKLLNSCDPPKLPTPVLP